MQKQFIQAYNIDKQYFEFKTDSHWNSVGHAAVSKGIENSSLWKKFMEDK